jgi:hypothetical protein
MHDLTSRLGTRVFCTVQNEFGNRNVYCMQDTWAMLRSLSNLIISITSQ